MARHKKVRNIWDFRVEKDGVGTTNIHSIDFKNNKIVWYYKTDEEHIDNLSNVKLYAFVEKLGYLPVGPETKIK